VTRALEVVLVLQRRVRSLLNEHRAEQVKAIGDGLMLRCGEPRAAIVLGLRLVEELAEETDFPPVRVGIHSGLALANEGDRCGRTVNVAARPCSVARSGEVVVSECARQAAGQIPGVQWSERELYLLRNVSEPVPAHLASSCQAAVRPAGAVARRRNLGLASPQFAS
jgi:class 3 adenylate cyclase